MESASRNDSDPVDATKHHDDREPDPVDPDDGDDPGLGGGGGPAAIIYGEDQEAEEHGDRLARDPDDSV